MTDSDRIMERYDNKLNPFNGKPSVADRLKSMNCTKIGECLQYLKIRTFPNTMCLTLRHMPVLQQQRGSECGFHMIWNAKCLIRVIQAAKSFDQIHNLLCLTNMRKYQNDVRRMKKLLLKCTNDHFVNAEDKKELRSFESTL
mmetsp:Transcript_22135/g.29589  ORF Transcript_22135/g.29589 Transcript_22135/m.29589 type:complete len:142 (-) Transcript_22135:1939-2364(-)